MHPCRALVYAVWSVVQVLRVLHSPLQIPWSTLASRLGKLVRVVATVQGDIWVSRMGSTEGPAPKLLSCELEWDGMIDCKEIERQTRGVLNRELSGILSMKS
jgi:hypothetical protein